jgi:hypothetical protein
VWLAPTLQGCKLENLKEGRQQNKQGKKGAKAKEEFKR